MKIKHMLIVPVILGFVLALQATAMAQDGVERIGKGEIDWVGYRVSAEGIGAPPLNAANAAQARAMARRAAVVVARRNLLEVVKGVHIDSVSTVENFIATNDVILSRVQGVLEDSAIDTIENMSDGSVRAVVGMPLSGRLGETLLSLAPPPQGAAPSAVPVAGGALQDLERRVESLERAVARLERMGADAKAAVQLTAAVLSAWQAWYEANAPRLALAAAQPDLAGIQAQLARQQSEIAALSRQVDQLSARISGRAAPAPAAKKAPATPYTGLVIDARNLKFKPCLRPSVFGADKHLLYPGPGVSQARALGNGYVRFYRNLGQAQKSDLVGGLPLTVKPPNTYRNARNLQLGSKDTNVLTTILEAPDSFLSECRVVVVF